MGLFHKENLSMPTCGNKLKHPLLLKREREKKKRQFPLNGPAPAELFYGLIMPKIALGPIS